MARRALLSASRSKRSEGSESRRPAPLSVPATGPRRCWITWVSSWASVCLSVPPSPITTWFPLVYARAPTSAADAFAALSSWMRTSEKSAPSRRSMSARVPPSSGLPPARTTSWTAERWTGASSASWPHPAPCRCCCFRRWTTTAFPTVACSPRSPEACAGGAVTGLRTVDRASSVAFDLAFAWFCTGASFVGGSEPYVMPVSCVRLAQVLVLDTPGDPADARYPRADSTGGEGSLGSLPKDLASAGAA